MKKFPLAILMFCFLYTSLLASHTEQEGVEKLAKSLNLYAGAKATVQWKRVFSSPRHLKRYKLEKLDQTTKDKLEKYLIQHAADSEQPIVPGV